MEEIEFLKVRGKEFFEEAEELFRKGKYNLSALIWSRLFNFGDWPKTHYLSELIP